MTYVDINLTTNCCITLHIEVFYLSKESAVCGCKIRCCDIYVPTFLKNEVIYQKLYHKNLVMNCEQYLSDYMSNIVLYSLVIVAEVTQPSLGVGYELGRAVAMGKRILCLYRPQENKRKFTPFFLQKNITCLMIFSF